ncbi:helix-turn-helix domain-containing protein [Paraburkholderia silviterrae]|uniref:Helix-turn-helix domain-containing protein n=2 Tax=Paraburkholderia silviterrae TaxID=2528715 RepID=A0A4R5M067_9BURK|nr:helix-turn-helix domain-containing protein [Paraburkholderia silviterrae]
MQAQIDVTEYWKSMDQRAVVRPREATLNVAIVLCDGFSLFDLSLVAEVFRQLNQFPDVSCTIDNRVLVTMVSARGGYVTNSVSVRIRTDAIDEHLAEHFDGVFVLGGAPENVASVDPTDLRALRKLLMNASSVKWNEQGWAVIEASGYEPTSAAERGWPESYRRKNSSTEDCASLVGQSVNSSLSAALSFIPGSLYTEIAHRIMRNVVAPSLDLSCADDDALNEVSVVDRVHAAAQWITKNCRRSISVAQAAEVARMSERTFLRHFKVVTGRTPSEYLLDARFEMTCRLLRETTLPVDKIARRCGMSSGERISRVFRKRLSQTPTEYRAAHRTTSRST